jgi:hypothetical protein
MLDAFNLLIWEGLPRKQAAAQAGVSEHGLYKALRKPEVRAYYLRELEVLRTSERPRNIHTLVEVRDDPANKMARVQAVRTLEQMAEDGARERPAAPFAGLIVQVITSPLTDAPSTRNAPQVIDNVEDEQS